MSIKSYGITVAIGGSTAVNGLKSVSLSGSDVSFIDTTTHDGDGWKSYIGGLKDGGTLELSGDYDINDGGQDDLRTLLGETTSVVVTFSDLSTAEFDAIIGPYSVENPLDETATFTSSLKITGAVTYAPTAGDPE